MMHPALKNLEVISTISSYTQRRSLPTLASTCRAFEHPALNALWRDLQSVEPLVRCLPSDLFGVDRAGARVVLQKPVDGKMWDTLFKYTSRVQSITVTQSDCSAGLEPLSVLMLSCPLTPVSLFPNLHKLAWHADGTHIFAQFLRMALVPSMLVFHVEISSSASSAFLSVLSSLGTLCPRLQDMTIRVECITHGLLEKITPFITQPISQLHHLQTLSVQDLGSQGIKCISQLPALQSLDLNLRASSAWNGTPQSQFPGFHGLKWLGISARTVEQAVNFFGSFQVVRSREIKVDLISQGAKSTANGSKMLSQLFPILKERCDNDTLKSFSLIGHSKNVLHPEPGIFTPLHAFFNLTQLLMEGVRNISMSDQELCQLARAWPKLQVLKISRYVSTYTIAVPTFHGLIELLRLCPALASLSLVVDATKLDGIDLKCPGGGSRNKRLEFLTLGNSSIKSPLNVALILSGLFHRLEQVNLACWRMDPSLSSLPEKPSEMGKWELVNSFLGAFSVVKERCIEELSSDCA